MTGLKTSSLLKRFRTASAGVCAALAVTVTSFSASVAAQAYTCRRTRAGIHVQACVQAYVSVDGLQSLDK